MHSGSPSASTPSRPTNHPHDFDTAPETPKSPGSAPHPSFSDQKAIVAVEHSILTAVWHMLTDDVDYHDLGGDYFARLDPERAMHRIVRQANALGFTVRFDPIQAA